MCPAAAALLCARSTLEMELLSQVAEWKVNVLSAPSLHSRRAATASPRVKGWFHLFQGLSLYPCPAYVSYILNPIINCTLLPSVTN